MKGNFGPEHTGVRLLDPSSHNPSSQGNLWVKSACIYSAIMLQGSQLIEPEIFFQTKSSARQKGQDNHLRYCEQIEQLPAQPQGAGHQNINQSLPQRSRATHATPLTCAVQDCTVLSCPFEASIEYAWVDRTSRVGGASVHKECPDDVQLAEEATASSSSWPA